MSTNLNGYVFNPNRNTALPLGKVDGNGTTIEHKFDALNVTVADQKPKVETVRELRIDYTESLGEADKSLRIETFATFKELRKLVRELMGVDA